MAISIGGDLNGGMTMIDLVINDGFPLSDWVNKPVLQLDSSYSAGNLAALTAYFRLGNAELTSSPYTVTAIPTESGGYTIDGGGKVQAVP
jgi:hypothetical protein